MKMFNENDKNLTFIPLEEASVPPSGLIEHFKDQWWIVHPQRGLVFWKRNPQCNSNYELAKRFWEIAYPWAEIRFIKSVFRQINLNDYV